MKIDYRKLKQYCLQDMEKFESVGDVYDTKDGMFIYKDNGSKILAVAHLDTVLSLRHFYVNTINKDDYVFNAQLDDRLGVYVICDLLPTMGLKYDILLTEGEEAGRSTAAYFTNDDKQYNWVFSFDRRGEDVVTYQYEDKEWKKTIKASGFKNGLGSFSDIVFLDHLGVKCLNIGTGYYGEHSDLCYFSVNTLQRQVGRFYDFYKKNSEIKFPHVQEEAPVKYGHYGNYENTNYDYGQLGDIYDNDVYCSLCSYHIGRTKINNIWVCDSCLAHCDTCVVCGALYAGDEIEDGFCVRCREEIINDEE